MEKTYSLQEFSRIIDIFFSAMLHTNDAKRYYLNKRSHKVYSLVSGYLSDLTSKDQTLENKILYNRILNSAPVDNLEDENLLKIPTLQFYTYCKLFEDTFKDYPTLLSQIEPLKKLYFYEEINMESYKKIATCISIWYENEGEKKLSLQELKELISLTYIDFISEWITLNS